MIWGEISKEAGREVEVVHADKTGVLTSEKGGRVAMVICA